MSFNLTEEDLNMKYNEIKSSLLKLNQVYGKENVKDTLLGYSLFVSKLQPIQKKINYLYQKYSKDSVQEVFCLEYLNQTR